MCHDTWWSFTDVCVQHSPTHKRAAENGASVAAALPAGARWHLRPESEQGAMGKHGGAFNQA